MRTVAALRAKLAVRYRAQARVWAGQENLGADAAYVWPLQPPTERDMAADPNGVAAWVRQWVQVAERRGVSLEWVQRRWPSYGTQRLPDRVVIAGATAIAELAGQGQQWDRLCRAVRRLRAHWPDADYLGDALTARARDLASMNEADVDRLVAVVDWLVAHPESELLPRELPVIGLHTKWYERHSSTVGSFVASITGSSDLGLAGEAQRFRVRVLDPAVAPGPLVDFTAPVAELTRLPVAPAAVLVVENLTSLAALPPLDGVIAVHGRGFGVTQLAQTAWVANAARLLYWGDLDTYGFEILARCRAVLPQVRSVLMDRATLARFADRAVAEPRPYRAEIPGLTPDEAITLATVRETNGRLEQERLDRAYVSKMLTAELAASPSG